MDGLMSNLGFNQVAKIKVFGIGGGGNNAINRMVEDGVQGVEFFVANTDLQVLQASKVENKIILGNLGAGADPEVGRRAAMENEDIIRAAIEGADMVYITAGLGGGTGTGAAPIFAKIAKEIGALTVGIVTKPFSFEGPRRMRQADEGLAELCKYVDSLIVVSNDQLLNVIGIPVYGFIVTDGMEEQKEEHRGLPLLQLSQIRRLENDSTVVLALNMRYTAEVITLLDEYGFYNYIKYPLMTK